jgi:hypothetical protein
MRNVHCSDTEEGGVDTVEFDPEEALDGQKICPRLGMTILYATGVTPQAIFDNRVGQCGQ